MFAVQTSPLVNKSTVLHGKTRSNRSAWAVKNILSYSMDTDEITKSDTGLLIAAFRGTVPPS